MTEATATGPLVRLIYKSRNEIPPENFKQELGKVFLVARRNNKGKDVTGALMFYATVRWRSRRTARWRAASSRVGQWPTSASTAIRIRRSSPTAMGSRRARIGRRRPSKTPS